MTGRYVACVHREQGVAGLGVGRRHASIQAPRRVNRARRVKRQYRLRALSGAGKRSQMPMIDCRRVGRTESGSCLGLRGPWRDGGAPAGAACCPRPQRWYSAGMKCICCTPAGGWVCCYGREGAPEAADRLPPFKQGGSGGGSPLRCGCGRLVQGGWLRRPLRAPPLPPRRRAKAAREGCGGAAWEWQAGGPKAWHHWAGTAAAGAASGMRPPGRWRRACAARSGAVQALLNDGRDGLDFGAQLLLDLVPAQRGEAGRWGGVRRR